MHDIGMPTRDGPLPSPRRASPDHCPSWPYNVCVSTRRIFFLTAPGVTGALSGPVEQVLSQDGVRVEAGLFDDPFFFDLQGFKDTASTGTLSFDSSRDFFAGQNLTAIVISIPRDRIENGTSPIDVWGTTARIGGQM